MREMQVKTDFVGNQVIIDKDMANILVQVGKFALVRMNKKLKDKISTCSRPVSLDIEQKLIYLGLVQDNLAYFGEVLIGSELALLEYLTTPRTDEEVALLFLEYYKLIFSELKGIENFLSDTNHYLDLDTFHAEKEKLNRLPQNSYNAVFNFYQNFTTYKSAFTRLNTDFSKIIAEDAVDLRLAISVLSQIAANTSKMIAATGDVFDQ